MTPKTAARDVKGAKLRWVGQGWKALAPAGHGWSRGYAFTDGGAYLEGDEIVSHLAKQEGELPAAAARLNGCFAAALDEPRGSCFITDRYGTIPVYVNGSVNVTRASDDPWDVIATFDSRPALNPLSALDLLRTGYVTGLGTLIEGLETIPPASVVWIGHDGLRTERYWRYGYHPRELDWEAAEEQLEHVLRRVAARTTRALESRAHRGALTLSGGLDSRVLASILSAESRDPLLAFSYGMREDPEIDVARRVAAHLGMPHREAFLTSEFLNDDFIERSVKEVGLTTRFTCGIGARHLRTSEADVMIPGHTGDFISGGHLPAQTGLVRTRDQLRRYLDLAHFRYAGSERALRRIVRLDYAANKWKTLEQTTSDFDMSEDTLGLIDRWNVENRQRRLILMELRAYEALGSWMLPFYDYELVDFFATIPHEQRIAQNLYVRTAANRLFTGGGDGLLGIRRIGSRSMEVDRTRPKRVRQLQRLQPLSGWALQLGLASARDFARQFRPKPPQLFGTDPIKGWFVTDERVRSYLLERVASIDVGLLDADALRTALLQGSGEERLYNRLLPGAITVQVCAERAGAVWRDARVNAAT